MWLRIIYFHWKAFSFHLWNATLLQPKVKQNVLSDLSTYLEFVSFTTGLVRILILKESINWSFQDVGRYLSAGVSSTRLVMFWLAQSLFSILCLYQLVENFFSLYKIVFFKFPILGRYRGIRRPLQQRTQGHHSVVYKVALTWGLGLLLASPIPVLSLLDINNIMPQPLECAMTNQHFLIFGSLLAFYLPMVIMVVTYVLTVHHLKNQKLLSGTLTGARHQVSKNSVTSGDCNLNNSRINCNNLIKGGSYGPSTNGVAVRNGHNKYQYSFISGTETSHRYVFDVQEVDQLHPHNIFNVLHWVQYSAAWCIVCVYVRRECESDISKASFITNITFTLPANYYSTNLEKYFLRN